MKVIAQGDPVEYDVQYAGDACRLYRDDMTRALIGVVTVNTDHERQKEMRTQRDRLRAALAGLVGAESKEELEAMEIALRLMPVPDEDKAAMLNAIHALLAKGA
jgi:hypothetical protein